MLLIRPVRLDDLDALVELAAQAGVGLTTFPRDPGLLRKRIVKSVRSFEDMADRPGGETYLFVLEDTETKRPVGTCGIMSKAGGFEPFYAYRLDTALHASSSLGVRNEFSVLTLVAEHSGPCEIGSLFLARSYRRDGNARLLSLSRFLFMAERPDAFDPTVIAEIRGVSAEGRSPFWDALGRHFFRVEFPRADELSGADKRFIADLMPKHPVYAFLLPEEARRVIGVPHDESLPAMKLLEAEGFRFAGMVDIFDAGPVLSCPLKDIRAVKAGRRAVVAIGEPPADAEPMLIANVRHDFRACRARLVEDGSGCVTLAAETAVALGVAEGDTVRYVALRESGSLTSAKSTSQSGEPAL